METVAPSSYLYLNPYDNGLGPIGLSILNADNDDILVNVLREISNRGEMVLSLVMRSPEMALERSVARNAFHVPSSIQSAFYPAEAMAIFGTEPSFHAIPDDVLFIPSPIPEIDSITWCVLVARLAPYSKEQSCHKLLECALTLTSEQWFQCWTRESSRRTIERMCFGAEITALNVNALCKLVHFIEFDEFILSGVHGNDRCAFHIFSQTMLCRDKIMLLHCHFEFGNARQSSSSLMYMSSLLNPNTNTTTSTTINTPTNTATNINTTTSTTNVTTSTTNVTTNTTTNTMTSTIITTANTGGSVINIHNNDTGQHIMLGDDDDDDDDDDDVEDDDDDDDDDGGDVDDDVDDDDDDDYDDDYDDDEDYDGNYNGDIIMTHT